jgi:hypothetical protein
LETKSISRLISLLELGGQTALVRIHPAGEPSANGASSTAPGWSQEGLSPPSAPPWRAELYMMSGQLQYCIVYNAVGERKLTGDQALGFLGQMGGLSYELLPYPSRPGTTPPPENHHTGPLPRYPTGYPGSGSGPGPYRPPEQQPDIYQTRPDIYQTREAPWSQTRPSLPPPTWQPTRTRWGETVVQNPQRLTRDQRRVLALINGQRSVSELSRLLGFTIDALYEVLAFFQEQNLIS